MNKYYSIIIIFICLLVLCSCNNNIAEEYTIAVSPSSDHTFQIDYNGGTESVTISGSSVWSAKIEGDFVSLSKYKGGNYGRKFDESILITVVPNPSVTIRKAKILIFNDDDDSLVATYYIEQSLNESEMNKYEAVDLGLSVKWASQNFDTSSNPSIQGLYGWGDPTGCLTATSDNYANGFNSVISGTEYDVVTQAWGPVWRIPTKEEFQELYDKCTWKFVKSDEKTGFDVIGANGESIFLPITNNRESDVITVNKPYPDNIISAQSYTRDAYQNQFQKSWSQSIIYWTGTPSSKDGNKALAVQIKEIGDLWYVWDGESGWRESGTGKEIFNFVPDYRITDNHSISFEDLFRYMGYAIRPVRH